MYAIYCRTRFLHFERLDSVLSLRSDEIMKSRVLLFLALFILASAPAQDSSAQDRVDVPEYLQASLDTEHRAIRRDIPLTNIIQRALEAGTRDFTGEPGENYWQLQTDFNIEASLDPATQTISGEETITVHNNSGDELNNIVLRLDHNIFRGLVPRGSSVPAENTEGMVVTRLIVDGHTININARRPQFRRGQPRPEPTYSVSGLDQTVANITLGEPIAAGATFTVDIAWTTKLPGGPNGRGHRMTQRWDTRLFQPTQWFPRLAMYDDLRGWNTNVYLGPAEFFNTFGRYDVKIDVPGGWVVSGTGELQNPEEVLTEAARENLAQVLHSDDVTTVVGEEDQKTAEGSSHTWHFVADNVNDFAWATSADFIWTATRVDIPENGYIPLHMVYLPERAHLFENAAYLSRHALEFYSDLWAPYPFPQLTMQDGPSAGMEYPMVINSNQGAADHEVAHMWWPMMVGTNETWYGWMDEGFNSYMNILSRADRNDEEADLSGQGQSYGRVSGDETEPSMMWAANYGGNMYGYQTYRKAPPMLAMLGGIVGDDAVQEAMSEYTHAWAFKHPSPWDFMFFMSNALEMDLGWFWNYWLFTTESVDGSIAEVSQNGSEMHVVVRQDGQMPSPIVLEIEFGEDGPLLGSMPNTTMISENSARMRWPVDVWFDGNKSMDLTLDFGDRTINKITLDPDGRFPDGNADDNVWERE